MHAVQQPQVFVPKAKISDNFDSVVMLTWSDWRTEPRSNRYHYAVRFAKELPVYFVQRTEIAKDAIVDEVTENPNVRILHAGEEYGERQFSKLQEKLVGLGVRRPLYWIYNPYFAGFVEAYPAKLHVYHATEDYFAAHLDIPVADNPIREAFTNLWPQTDLAVAVSNGVGSSLKAHTPYSGPVLILPNGCDHLHWQGASANEKYCSQRVLFQGALNQRVDYPLLIELARRMPDWEFLLCGPYSNAPRADWENLVKRPNVKAIGPVHPDDLRLMQANAAVGIIPFRQVSNMTISLPLKAYEYVASGLPVVSTPIEQLAERPDLFSIATTAEGFEARIREVALTRWSDQHLERRRRAAAEASYDKRFEDLEHEIGKMISTSQNQLAPKAAKKKRVLVAYSASSTFVQTTLDYLTSFSKYLNADVQFVHVTHDAAPDFNLEEYDAIIHSYCARWPFPGYVSSHYSKALARYSGPKILAVQDEYDRTNNLKQAILAMGFDVVLTCIPKDQLEKVYPEAEFGHIEFVQVLTGYVPENPNELAKFAMPLGDRPYAVGYRGRDIGGHYGRLAWDKLEIGMRVKRACEERGLPCNIDWSDDSRIYGKDWFRFIGSCRATLGTESGSNVFDYDGSFVALFHDLTEKNGGQRPSYEEFLPRVRMQDDSMDMGQISPKVFEAAALRTPLILLRGRYSDALRPEEHYIPLEKDYSNLQAVLDRLQDIPALEAMANRLYEHIVASGKYSYTTFVKEIDQLLDRKIVELSDRRRVPRRSAPKIKRPEEINEEDWPLYLEEATLSPRSTDSFYSNLNRREANIYKREVVRLNDILKSEISRICTAYEEQGHTYRSEIARLSNENLKLARQNGAIHVELADRVGRALFRVRNAIVAVRVRARQSTRLARIKQWVKASRWLGPLAKRAHKLYSKRRKPSQHGLSRSK